MVSILWQISQALEYIASLRMIHRDVACRNILLFDNYIAKLSDFGLCCYSNEKTDPTEHFPMRWLSIEALVDRIFSEKSDVWAFGILMYEAYTFGAVPYSTLSNTEILLFLQEDKRLEPPLEAPIEIQDLMMDCWHTDSQKRPSFKEIREILWKFIENKAIQDYDYIQMIPK